MSACSGTSVASRSRQPLDQVRADFKKPATQSGVLKIVPGAGDRIQSAERFASSV